MKISKFNLMLAFFTGQPFPEMGMHIINSIEREDGSNQSYNVTGQTPAGSTITLCVRVY